MSSGDRIREAREGAGLSQEALAERIGVHQGTVSAWETEATKRISTSHYLLLSQATGYALEWLRTGEGEKRLGPVGLSLEDALGAFLAAYPADPVPVVRAVVTGYVGAGLAIPRWLTERWTELAEGHGAGENHARVREGRRATDRRIG